MQQTSNRNLYIKISLSTFKVTIIGQFEYPIHVLNLLHEVLNLLGYKETSPDLVYSKKGFTYYNYS